MNVVLGYFPLFQLDSIFVCVLFLFSFLVLFVHEEKYCYLFNLNLIQCECVRVFVYFLFPYFCLFRVCFCVNFSVWECTFFLLYLFYSCYNEFFFLFPLFIGINSNSLLFL